MNVTLQLRYTSAPRRTTSAWLVPGTDPGQWLAEMTAWSVPLADARLMAGEGVALVLLSGENQPAKTQFALAYGKIGERLFVPVEAAFDPPLDDDEVAALVPPGEALYLWRPEVGLLQFEPHQALKIAQLVAPPPQSGSRWNVAQPGIATNSRLLSIVPLSHPSPDDFLQEGRDDISSQPLAVNRLLPLPNEPAGGAIGRAIAGVALTAAAGAASALGAAASAVAAGMAQLTGGKSGASAADRHERGAAAQAQSGPNWLERLRQWAHDQQQALKRNIDQIRHCQVERLLQALQNSPDEGLRYALPLTQIGMHRGVCPPGGSLTEREVDFNLSRLGGGQSADFWNLLPEYRQRLAARYRELANREIALGRHRRAAYILAELLGDLSAAAVTLADGGHCREAAILYQQRLNQPLAAARCLARGGLVAEAIALFEQLEEWEAAGDLYRQLEQSDAANQAYRRAVQRRLSAGDRLAAAAILEGKLVVPQEAYPVLIAGWPESPQAQRCLDQSFELLARHRWHDLAAKEVIARLKETPQSTAMHVSLAVSLAQVATKYPDDEVRQIAAETTRQIVSARLAAGREYEAEKLLAALQALVPGDRLLDRDCRRYQAKNDKTRRIHTNLKPAIGDGQLPRLVKSFRLPQAEWKVAATSGEEFYAAGFFRRSLIVVRGRWDGSVQLPVGEPWIIREEHRSRPILLAADPQGLEKLFVHLASQCPARELHFPATDTFPFPLAVGSHRSFTHGAAGICCASSRSVLVLEADLENLEADVSCFETDRLMGVQGFDLSPKLLAEQEIHSPLPFYARERTYYLGLGTKLLSLRGRQEVTTVHSPIRAITGSGLHTRARIVLACQRGGVVVWGATARQPATAFSMDLVEPVVGLARGGWLAAATSDTIEVLSTHGGQLTWRGAIAGPGQEPLAVLATHSANRFAVLTTEGLVNVYEVLVQ